MRKYVRLALLAALILTLGSVGIASAQSGVTYSSSFQVQNLASVPANIQLDYYSQATGGLLVTAPYTITGNSSRTFFPTDVAVGFNGSLVISSDQDIRAINNITGSGPANYFDSTNGFQAGATTMSLPLIMCNNSGFNTWFNVQNAGGAAATITITYIPGSAGVSGKSESAVIQPGAAKTFDQATGSSTVNCSTLATAGGKFIGSATITSDQPVAAVVMQVNTTTFQVLMGYGGFTGGSNTVALPLLMANNSAFYTGYQIQNADTTSAAVTVHYGPNTGGTFAPADETFTLAPGASKTVIMNAAPPANSSANDWTGKKYIGSGTITSTGGKVVAIVNQTRAGAGAMGSSYNGFDPATSTTIISAPLIMANNSSYYTAYQVQNADTTSAAVIVHYGPNLAGTFAPADETFTLASGASKTVIQNAAPPANGSASNWTGQKYIGSATITSTGGKIVAIVNQQSLTRTGDQLATNDAFNLP